MIEAGHVLVNGSIAQKATRQVKSSDQVVVANHFPRYVGRGAEKLLGLLDRHPLEIRGADVADLGSSTGGFTQVLLESGARKVFAIDVGKGQLDQSLRNHPQVKAMEGIHLRYLSRDEFELPNFGVAVGDLSFISLTKVADAVVDVILEGCGVFALLVKPQFEVEREIAARYRGVIVDPQFWRSSMLKVADSFTRLGATIEDVVLSPISGGDGNREFFLVGSVSPGVNDLDLPSVEEMIDREISLLIPPAPEG